MPTATKEAIANAVKTLLFEKKVKKLTVKDIVEESHMTRQTFYYHFEDIPDLLRWIFEQSMEHTMTEIFAQKDGESALRYFFVLALSARPYVERTVNSNYGEEVKRLLREQFYRFFMQAARDKNLYPGLGAEEMEFVVRYHTGAIMNLLQNWTPRDTAQLDSMVRWVGLILGGEIGAKPPAEE